MKRTVLFFFLVAAALLAGCKSSPIEPALTKTDLLTGTVWQVKTALALGPAAGQTTDITSQFPFVTMTFTKDGRYLTPVQSGTWQFINSETGILFDGNSLSQMTAEIIELSASVLHFTITTPGAALPMPVDLSFTALPQATSTSPLANFDTLWTQFDSRYSFFEIKGINWDSLRTVFRPQVTSQTSDAQLFQIMSSMLANLKDGHVGLTTPFNTYAYTEWYSRYPTNFLGTSNMARYLTIDYGTTAGGYMRYGMLPNNLGYLYIGPNLMGNEAVWSAAIDVILDSLKNTRAIVVDIRNNGGGNDALGNIVVGRFADQIRTYSYVRWRNGPRHSDFTDFLVSAVGPQGLHRYTNRVALLTNRRCFSSAEGTILMFRAFPNVTIIGDTTGGGSANPIALQLPNAWSYRVSRWIQYTAQKTIFEGIGLAPDIPVWISPADSAAGRDAILERAMQFLK